MGRGAWAAASSSPRPLVLLLLLSLTVVRARLPLYSSMGALDSHLRPTLADGEAVLAVLTLPWSRHAALWCSEAQALVPAGVPVVQVDVSGDASRRQAAPGALAVSRWNTAPCAYLAAESLRACLDAAVVGPRCQPWEREAAEAGWAVAALHSAGLAGWAARGAGRPLLLYWSAEHSNPHAEALAREALEATMAHALDVGRYWPVVLVTVQHQHAPSLAALGALPARVPRQLLAVDAALRVSRLHPLLPPAPLGPPPQGPPARPCVAPCLCAVALPGDLLGAALYEYARAAAVRAGVSCVRHLLRRAARWHGLVHAPSLWLWPHANATLPLEYRGPIHVRRIALFLEANVR